MGVFARVNTPSSPVRERERGRGRKRVAEFLCLQGCAHPLHRSVREREKERERERESDRGRERCRIWFFKGMTGLVI